MNTEKTMTLSKDWKQFLKNGRVWLTVRFWHQLLIQRVVLHRYYQVSTTWQSRNAKDQAENIIRVPNWMIHSPSNPKGLIASGRLITVLNRENGEFVVASAKGTGNEYSDLNRRGLVVPDRLRKKLRIGTDTHADLVWAPAGSLSYRWYVSETLNDPSVVVSRANSRISFVLNLAIGLGLASWLAQSLFN